MKYFCKSFERDIYLSVQKMHCDFSSSSGFSFSSGAIAEAEAGVEIGALLVPTISNT